MPSQEFLTLAATIRERTDSTPVDIPVEIARQGMDMVAGFFPSAENCQFDPVDVEGIAGEWVLAPDVSAHATVLYLHGGGYSVGSIISHRGMASYLSGASSARFLLIDYRLAPEHPHPAAVEDAVAAYRWLIDRGTRPENMALGGDSAGGGLAIATLVAARDAGLPMPSCAFVLSPWVDMEGIGESYTTKAEVDPMLKREGSKLAAERYLAGIDARTPLASPIYADLSGLPPLLIHVGEAEILLDDSNMLAQRARAAGVEVILETWPDMIHVWHYFASMVPESREAIEVVGRFLKKRLRA